MVFEHEEIAVLNALIGSINEREAASMKKNLECFLSPKVSIFIPTSGYCPYAITPGHTHPSYTFIYYFQPISDFIVEGKHLSYDLAEGKCLSAMSPGILHQEIEEDYFQSYIAVAIDETYFKEAFLPYSSAVPVFRGEIFLPHPELLGILRCFMLEAVRSQRHGLLDSIATLLTNLIIRSLRKEPQKEIQLFDRFEVNRAITYMNSHLSEKVSAECLAEEVSLSVGHFSKIFKDVTGETPIDFLNILRLQKARLLLINPAVNITEIAMRCGFNSSSYFSSCFLRKYRMTPSAFRQEVKNKS